MMLLSDFLEKVYIPDRLVLRRSTVYQAQATIRLYSAWLGRDATTDDLTLLSVRGWLSDYAHTRATSTVNSKRAQILALWRCARKEGMAKERPSGRRIRKLPGDDIQPPVAWSIEDIGKILAFVRGTFRPQIGNVRWRDWWESIILVAFDTAERRSALLAVEPADVDLDRRTVLFRKRKGKPRVCRIAPDTVEAVRRIYNPKRLLLWHWPFSAEHLSGTFRWIVAGAGLPRSKSLFHQLRRTSGTLVEAGGGDGARHIGDTRAVFERHYLDVRFLHSDMDLLPRPK